MSHILPIALLVSAVHRNFHKNMSTYGDAALEAALESLKIKNAKYLQNQTPQTTSSLVQAMDRQANALAKCPNTATQAMEMRKVKQDFETTNTPSKRLNIADKLATSLVSETDIRWLCVYLSITYYIHTG